MPLCRHHRDDGGRMRRPPPQSDHRSGWVPIPEAPARRRRDVTTITRWRGDGSPRSSSGDALAEENRPTREGSWVKDGRLTPDIRDGEIIGEMAPSVVALRSA